MPKIENRPGDLALSDKDICRIFGISKPTLIRYRKLHGMPGPSFRVGQSTFTWKSEVESWVAEREAQPTDYKLPHHLKGKSKKDEVVPREEDQPRESAEPSGEDMNAPLTEIAEARKLNDAREIFRAALERNSGDPMSAARFILTSNRKNEDALLSALFWATTEYAAQCGERDGVEAGQSGGAEKASHWMPASTPTNSGAEGHAVYVPQRDHGPIALPPLPERGEEGQRRAAPNGASSSMPTSPLPISKNTGGAGQSPSAPARLSSIARPPVPIRKPSPVELKAARKVEDVAAASIFKTFTVRGRPIGSYTFGELKDAECKNLIEAGVCHRLRMFAGGESNRSLRVEDQFDPGTLERIIAEVTREVADAA